MTFFLLYFAVGFAEATRVALKDYRKAVRFVTPREAQAGSPPSPYVQFGMRTGRVFRLGSTLATFIQDLILWPVRLAFRLIFVPIHDYFANRRYINELAKGMGWVPPDIAEKVAERRKHLEEKHGKV